MNITILDDYQDSVKQLDCFSLLNAHKVVVLTQTYTPAQLLEELRETQVLVLIRERTQVSESLISQLPKLKLISQTGKVSAHIDPLMCKRYGVEVCEGVGSPVAPAELCWSLIMAASRQLPAYIKQLHDGRWQQSNLPTLGRSLNGLTIGIWGYGKIGKRIAQYANAFGMRIWVWGSDSSRRQAKLDGYNAAPSKAQFFQNSDVLSLHLRLNEHTQDCVSLEDLQLMKPDSLFVNTSRAQLIQSGALYQVMSSNPSRSAAVDVYEHEPATSTTQPLIGLPNVLATPHLGYVEANSYELYFKIAFENVVAFAKGQPQNLCC